MNWQALRQETPFEVRAVGHVLLDPVPENRVTGKDVVQLEKHREFRLSPNLSRLEETLMATPQNKLIARDLRYENGHGASQSRVVNK